MLKDRIRTFAFGIVFGLFAILVQATLFYSVFQGKIDVNLVFGLLIWIGFFKSNPEGVLLSFILAWLQGAVSGALSGVFLFAGMSLYVLCWILRARFAPVTGLGRFGFALAMGIFYKLVLVVSLELFVGGAFIRAQSLGYMLLEVLLNAILALLVFALFSRLKGFLDLIPEQVKPRRH